MKFDALVPPRTFRAGKDIQIRDCGRMRLDPDEQITFVTEDGAEYDVARKAWGFYATPSLNGRLVDHKLHAALVRNEAGRYYVFLLEDGKRPEFERYLHDERQTLVAWLDDPRTLGAIEAAMRVPQGPTVRVDGDAWLSTVLGRACHRVLPTREGTSTTTLPEHVAAQTAPSFYYAKVPTDDVATVDALVRAGMSPVDVNVTLTWDTLAPTRATKGTPKHLDIHALRPEEATEVVAIAQRSFERSRFHLDPRFEREEADAVKREWIANYARGARGDHLFVASLAGTPVGFLAALKTGEGDRAHAVIDLVAVDQTARGAGVGRALVDAFIAHYKGKAARLQVGTQAANVPSLAMYQAAGFVVSHTQYVLHMHAGQVGT